MKRGTSIIRDINDQVCGTGGMIKRFCKDSTTSEGKNYAILLLFAFFVQYMLPLFVVFSLIPVIGLNIIAFFNPLVMITAPVMMMFDLGLIVTLLIASFVLTVFYWLFYFKIIGVLAAVPIMMGFIGYVLNFIPSIGNTLSLIISITPWMPIVIVMHWLAYSGDPRKLVVPLVWNE